MLRAKGNIWSRYPECAIVIPTNIGWTRFGYNVMGRGLAKEASQRFPYLAQWYGNVCQEFKDQTTPIIYPVPVYEKIPDREKRDSITRYKYQSPVGDIILFPVKPLNSLRPWLSWQNPASLQLIELSLDNLVHHNEMWKLTKIALPLVGCGNGGLSKEKVLPLLEQYLGDEYTLVELT